MAQGSTGSGDDGVTVHFGAVLDALKEGIAEANARIKEFATEGAEHVESLNKKVESFGKILTGLAELATLGWIGEQFMELGEKTAEYAEQLEHASQITSMSTQDIAALGFAAQTTGVQAESLQQALVLLSRNMQNVDDPSQRVAEAFKAVGLSAQDVKHMGTDQVLMKVADAFHHTQDSAAKTAVSVALFGRSGAQLIPLLDKGSSGIGELKDRAKELGLVLDTETNEQGVRLADTLAQMRGAQQGLTLQISAQMMPAMQQLAKTFTDVSANGNAVKTIGEAIGNVMKGAALAVGYVVYALSDTGNYLGAIAAYVNAIAHGNFQAAAEIEADRKQQESANDAWIDKLKNDLFGVTEAAHEAAKATEEVDGKGSITYDPNADAKAKKAQALADAKLQLQKAAEQASLSLQAEYLKADQAALDDSYKHNLVSIKEYYGAKLAIETEAIDDSIAAKKKELDATRAATAAAATPEARVQGKAKEVALLGQINVLEAQRNELVRKNAQEYADAEQKRQDELTTIEADRRKQATDSEIAMQRSVIDEKQKLRQIDNQQALAAQADLENQEYQALQASLDAKQQLVHGDIVKQQQLDAEREKAYQDHQLKLTQIAQQAELDRLKLSMQADQQVENSFGKMVSDLLGMHKTLRGALLEFGQAVAHTFQNLIAQRFAERLFGAGSAGGSLIDMLTKPILAAIEAIVTKWIGGEAAITAAKSAQAATREGISSAEATTNATATAAAVSAQQAASVAAVMGWASAAAVAAMASVAAIPFYGWAMAPEVGAETYALGMGYLASAEGGWWQIPNDQIAQVHKNEMVLPAEHAANLRGLLAGGAQQQQGGGDMHVHYSPSIHAWDGTDVKRALVGHPEAVAAAVKNAIRLGYGKGMG